MVVNLTLRIMNGVPCEDHVNDGNERIIPANGSEESGRLGFISTRVDDHYTAGYYSER
jgi:hypothetical protein